VRTARLAAATTLGGALLITFTAPFASKTLPQRLFDPESRSCSFTTLLTTLPFEARLRSPRSEPASTIGPDRAWLIDGRREQVLLALAHVAVQVERMQLRTAQRMGRGRSG
jgi:hypothetical protein